jgi:beta-glucanase (GH16 family)
MIKRTILVFLLSLPGALADAQERTMESNTCPKTTHIFRPDSVPAAGPQWQLVLEDEFDGPAPDTSKWLTHAPWGSVLFFGNKDRFDSAQNGAAECAYAGNLQYQDGHLQLMVKKEDVNELSSYYRSDTFVEADGLPSRRTFHYSAGVLFSKKMYGPGKFEIRCKLPLIDGVWPAFWLYGSCGQEFDVFEFLNERYRESTADCNRRLHMTYHRESTCADPSTWFSHGTTAFDTVD